MEEPRLTRKASLWRCKYNRKAHKSQKTTTKYLWRAEEKVRQYAEERKSFEGAKSCCEIFNVRWIEAVKLECIAGGL